jgi:hypothetical protein
MSFAASILPCPRLAAAQPAKNGGLGKTVKTVETAGR